MKPRHLFTNPSFSMTALLLLLLLPSPPADAEVVWEQLPAADGFISDVKVHPSIGRQIEADSCVLEDATRLTRLEWWGTYDSDYFDAFLIRVFDDADGLPGASRYEFTFTEVPSQTDLGYRLYAVDLPEDPGLEIPAGQTVWISIAGANAYTGEPVGSEVFDWCIGTVTGYAREFALEGPWSAVTEFAQPAFRVHGDALTPVESSTMNAVKSIFR